MDTLIPDGTKAPDFSLQDLTGQEITFSRLEGQIVIINFWSAECPWAKRADEELLESINRWGDNVRILRIASNATDTPEQIAVVARERGLPDEMILLDSNQEVADLYGAKTTPHLFVLDEHGIVRYQGAINDITFRQKEATRHYLQEAIDALLTGSFMEIKQTNPYGCTVVRHV